MTTVAQTPENAAKISALKRTNQCRWAGTTVHTSLEACLDGIKLYSGMNSGWYNPVAARFPGVVGTYMINQDGSIFWEARVIKEGDKQFRIEYVTNAGMDDLEKHYFEALENKAGQ